MSVGPITERLAAYLKAASCRSRCYGTHDCFLFAADWCREAFGIDVAAEIRGKYIAPEDGAELMKTAHLPRAFDRAFRQSGFRRTRSPQLGDPAMISTSSAAPSGAIKLQRGYVVLAQGCGISRASGPGVRLLSAWTIDA
jgi:hypothetical protein